MEITKNELKKFLYIHLLTYLIDFSQLETDRKIGYYDIYIFFLSNIDRMINFIQKEVPPSLILGDDVTNLVYALVVVYIVITGILLSYTLEPSLPLLIIFEPFEPSLRRFDWLVDDNNLIDSKANDRFDA